MTIKRSGDGVGGASTTRAREAASLDAGARAQHTTTGDGSQVAKPAPLSSTVDGFDSEPPSDSRVTGSGTNAVEDLVREARGRASLLSSMVRVLDETKAKLESELGALKAEADAIAADTARPLDDKLKDLSEVRARMAKPRRRLVAIRRRLSTSTALSARDHDGAHKRARASFLRATALQDGAARTRDLAAVAAELKLPTEASAAGGTLRLDVEGVRDRALFASQLAREAPSLGDALALLELLGARTDVGASGATLEQASTARDGGDGPTQLLSRLHELRTR